jgi:hypothetical protein
MATLTYEASGSFRAWLKTLAHHAWRDLVDQRRRAGIGTGDAQMAALLSNPLLQLLERLRPHFELARAVRFAYRGE